MKIKARTCVRNIWVAVILIFVVLLTSCQPKSTNPFPDMKEWDLLIISDSTNWGVGQYYTKLIEQDMNVKVTLHDCWVGALSIGTVLKTLQSGRSWSSFVRDPSCNKPLSVLIREAEMMVLHANEFDSYPPDGSWNIPEDPLSCVKGGYEGKSNLLGFATYRDNMLKLCTPETFATYKAHIGAVLDEIDKIRDGSPLILRMTSAYIPIHSSWLKSGVNEVCTICCGYHSETIRRVAEEYGVPVADTMVGFNGKDYLSDPRESGYIGSDGIHPSDSGAQFIATLLQQTGYEYAGK